MCSHAAEVVLNFVYSSDVVVPQVGGDMMMAVKKEQERSTSVASLDKRFEVIVQYSTHILVADE